MANYNLSPLALEVKPFDLSAALDSGARLAKQRRDAALESQLNPLAVQEAQSGVARSQLAEVAAGLANDSGALALAGQREARTAQSLEYQNNLVARAAAVIDPNDPDAPQQWDDAMRRASELGAPSANQFIGQYSPDRQKRVVGAFGAKSPQAATEVMQGQPGDDAQGQPAAVLDRMYRDHSPQQLQQEQKHVADIVQAARSVLQSQDPVAAFNSAAAALGYPDTKAQDARQAISLANALLEQEAPVMRYLSGRVTGAAAGQPAPLVATPIQEVGGVLYGVDPYAKGGQATALTKRPMTLGSDAGGNPIAFDPATGAIRGQEAPDDTALGTFAGLLLPTEAPANQPGARNPLSSATGAAQFLDSTWLNVVKGARPDLVKGKSDQDILSMRADPALSRQMAAEYAADNAGKLRDAGQPVNFTTLAMAHKLGPGDADKVLDANPQTPLRDILSPEVMRANPQLAAQTAGSYVAGLRSQFGDTPVEAPMGATGTMSDDAVDQLAGQYVASGVMPPIGQGKAATAIRNRIYNKASEIQRATGVTGPDAVLRWANVKASTENLKNITKVLGMVGSSESTVQRNMDLVQQLAPKGGGPTGSPMLNRPIQELRKNVWGSPEVAQFDAAIGTVADEYAKVMTTASGVGGQALSDSARQEAYSRLSKASTLAQVNAVMGALRQEMANRVVSLKHEQVSAQEAIRTGGLAGGAAGAPPPAQAAAGPPPQAARVVGQVYPSPKGPVRWTAQGWVMDNGAQ